MERFFNIAGPCNPARHYTLPAMARLPDVSSLIRKEQYFVVHAQRQCGKTTAFLALTNEINAGTDQVAVYCSLEAVQESRRAGLCCSIPISAGTGTQNSPMRTSYWREGRCTFSGAET